MNKYTKLFTDFLHTMDFGLCKETDGYALIDYQGAYWGNIAEDRFDSAESIVDRLDIYIDDYFLDDLEEEAPNYGISDETIVDILGFADWYAWFVENKDKSPEEVRRLLEETFHCGVVFIPWDRIEKYGHSDGIIHYLGDNRVLMTNYDDFDKALAHDYLRFLEKHFDVATLKYNVKRKHERSWSYINFLQIGNLVLVPQLGIPEDEQALEQISVVMPNCEVIGIPALESVRRGGALNCISWNIKV